MNIVFYNLTDDKRKLNKNLVNGYTVENITLKKSDNDLNKITLILNANLDGYNYCYIPILERYYFIDTVSIMNSELKRYELSIDVLMTYKTQILNSDIEVTEKESETENIKLDYNARNELSLISSTQMDDVFNDDSDYVLITVG